MNNWINPKIVVGPTATGDYYFNRPELVAQIWEEVLKGCHILIAAPRRVGKSSVMEYMVGNCPEDVKGIFRNIQGIESEADFYKTIYELMLLSVSKFGKNTKRISDFFGGINVKSVTIDGSIEFGDKKEVDYLQEINKLLPKLSSNKLKIVLFVDELPEVLNNLLLANKTHEASSILNNLRQWRLTPEFKKHFSMVLAGSVGIQHIVKKIDGRIADINDLTKINFEPLTTEEAHTYINWATDEATIQYNSDLKAFLLEKIEYHLPYFINLMLNEINQSASKLRNTEISNLDIEKAFNKVIKNSDHFSEWKNRLTQYFAKDDANFMNEALLFIAHKNKLTKRKLYDLAVKHTKTNDYIELMDNLERDGYIVEQNENYVFVSPFLKAFWKRTNYDAK